MSSDRGLCGGIHSSVAKAIRTDIQSNLENTKIVCVGDKSRSILSRYDMYKRNESEAAIPEQIESIIDSLLIRQAFSYESDPIIMSG